MALGKVERAPTLGDSKLLQRSGRIRKVFSKVQAWKHNEFVVWYLDFSARNLKVICFSYNWGLCASIYLSCTFIKFPKELCMATSLSFTFWQLHPMVGVLFQHHLWVTLESVFQRCVSAFGTHSCRNGASSHVKGQQALTKITSCCHKWVGNCVITTLVSCNMVPLVFNTGIKGILHFLQLTSVCMNIS